MSNNNSENDVVTSPEPVADGKPSITFSEDGVMTSGKSTKPAVKKAVPVKKEAEKVALFSTRNVRWAGVGEIKKGYNIVSKTESQKWLKRDHVRLVDPEEIKREFED